jgi:hypothetical protein
MDEIAYNQYNADRILQTAAPLQYIDDEEVAQRLNHTGFRKSSHFVADFMDRRTQAQMVCLNCMSMEIC